MADEANAGGAGKTSKPTTETEERTYAILGAVGSKDSNPDELDWKVIDTVKATTQGKAKEALLNDNPDFPGDVKASAPGSGTVAGPTKLQELVKAGQLWLHAESGWNPKPVVINQPPPKFEGL